MITYDTWQGHTANGGADRDQRDRPIEEGKWYVILELDRDEMHHLRLVVAGPFEFLTTAERVRFEFLSATFIPREVVNRHCHECGTKVRPEDPKPPRFFCPTCGRSVFRHETVIPPGRLGT